MSLAPWRLKFYIRKWRASLYDKAICEQFATAIKESNKKTLNTMLATPTIKMKIDPRYQDVDGESFLHMAVRQGTWEFVTPVNKLGCPNNLQNKAGKMPCDITTCFKDVVGSSHYKPLPYASLEARLARRDALVEEMQAYYREDLTGGVYPGRRLVDDLNLTFNCDEGACEIPDSWEALNAADKRRLTLHQRLAVAQHVSSARALKIETMERDKTSNCYVTAAISFILTDKKYVTNSKNSLQVVIIPVNVPGYLVYSDDATYAHAEEELFAYLNQSATTDALVAQLLKTSAITAGYKCYAVVFDLHTTYNMCGACEGKTYGIEGSHEAGVVQNLENSLVKVGIVLPDEKKTEDLLRPKKMQLTTSTRVSCHSTFPHSPPKDTRGHTYPTYSRASDKERNIANHKNAVIFHSTHATVSDLASYQFSSKNRRGYTPCFVPNQTAFVMKSNSSSSYDTRRQLQRPVKINKGEMQEGIAIFPDSSMRCSSYKASKAMVLHSVRDGDVGVVKILIGERLSNPGLLRKVMLVVQHGENIYHAAAKSGDMDMLELVDTYMSAYFLTERKAMIHSKENSPLASAKNLDIFDQLVKWGAQDPSGECGAAFYDELSSESAKLDFIGFYQDQGWDASFGEADMTYGFGY